MKYKKIQLKNGMPVLFIESHKSPVISVQMWVRTGSADESSKERGISHFIEHLVFKGTQNFMVGEIAKTVEGSGGELNAYTSFDQTVYYVTMPSSEASTALKVIFEMTSCPQFDPSEVQNEREVVIEEIKRGLDSPGRVASQLLFSTTFKKHPYGLPVIGFEKIIKKVSIKTLRGYFDERYHPRNMFLVVAGNIDTKSLKKALAPHDAMSSKKFRKVFRPKEPIQNKPRIKVQNSTFQDNYFHLGFRIPGPKHKDLPALETLSMILGQGDSSRLVDKLRIQRHLANSISCGLFSPKDDGIFLISGSYKQENFNSILEEIVSTLVEARTTLVSAEELKKVKTSIESEQFFSLETVDGLSRTLGSWEFLYEDPSQFERYLESINSLRASDLRLAAHKWLKPENLTLVALAKDSDLSKKELSLALASFREQIKKQTRKAKTLVSVDTKKTVKNFKKIKLTPNTPKTEVLDLPCGTTLILRQISETPLISARAAFAGGLREEPADRKSVVELLSRSWIGDINGLREADIYSFFESRAAGIGAFSGRNSIGLSMEMLKPFEKECGNLWSQILVSPSFQASILEREKSVLIHQIQNRNDKGAQRAILKLQEILFQGHPYQFDMMGTEESASVVKPDHLNQYWKKIANSRNLVVAISGNIDLDYWKELIQTQTSKLEPGSRHNRTFAVHFPLEPITHHQILNREQTHIAIGFPGLSLKNPNRYILQIIDSILSGQGGRLFIELRDKNSLAYSVGPIQMNGIETGYFGAYIGCSPEKTNKSVEMLLNEFKRLTVEPLSLTELHTAKRYILGRHHIDLQRTNHINSLILFNALYGVDLNEPFELEQKFHSITSEDVLRVANDLFSKPPVICTVGPDLNAN